jgi:hypothetical protein
MGSKHSGRIANLEKFPEIATKLLELIEAGCSTRHACDLIGLSEPVLYEWINKGKKPGSKQIYADLAKNIKESRRKFTLHHLGAIKRAGQQTWQASAWALERNNPREFGSPEVQLRNKLEEVSAVVESLKRLAIEKGLIENGGAENEMS